jgi:hypothetical protein
VVTDLDNDPGPVRTKTWNWTARDADSAIVYRFLVDQSAGGVPGGDYGAIATATKDAADGLWYLHVQARDRAGNATGVRTVSVTLDNTPPTVMINQAATQADPVATGPVVFTVVFSEPVADFATGGVTLGGTAGARTATVTGSYGGGAIRHAVTPDPLLIEVVGRSALNLAPGWNLVSLPVEPRDPAAATVLAATRAAAEGAAGAAARAVRQDRAATIHEGNVWRWIPGRSGYYQAVSELHALTGYWIYAGTAARVTIQGTPMGGTVSLPAEWNLVGPAAAVPVPADARLAGALWRWDAIAVGYTALGSTDLLLPGHGYWLFATDAVVLSLGQ